MILARLVEEERAASGRPIDAAEAVRLAGDLAATMDQLIVEGIDPQRLATIDPGEGLSHHWESALAAFRIVIDRWPAERARLGGIEASARRVALLDRQAERWRDAPPAGFVCAAGITDPAPAVARLLRTVAGLPQGMVVFADIDLAMPDEEWEALGPFAPDPATALTRRAIEVHPQFHLKLLLDRIGVARGEVSRWADASEHDAPAPRGRAIANALTPAAFTAKWTRLDASERRLSGVEAVELANPAEEAQAIALMLRGALEEDARTAALVTPDRMLARRVAAHADGPRHQLLDVCAREPVLARRVGVKGRREQDVEEAHAAAHQAHVSVHDAPAARAARRGGRAAADRGGGRAAHKAARRAGARAAQRGAAPQRGTNGAARLAFAAGQRWTARHRRRIPVGRCAARRVQCAVRPLCSRAVRQNRPPTASTTNSATTCARRSSSCSSRCSRASKSIADS